MRFRPRLNLVLDALMTLDVAALAGIGFMMKYVMPPGRERMEQYGRAVNLSWLGLNRHEWGTVHLCVAFVLLALIVVHVALHWQMIVDIYRRFIRNRSLRVVVAVILLAASLLLVIGPLLVTPTVHESGHREGLGQGEGRGYRGGRGAPAIQTSVPD